MSMELEYEIKYCCTTVFLFFDVVIQIGIKGAKIGANQENAPPPQQL
jgi:hypothetical protein